MTYGSYPYGTSEFGGSISLGTGSLEVISTPPGASIYIDDILQPGTTPTTIVDIIEGSHTITVTMPGFNDYTTPVIIEVGIIKTIPTIVLIPSEGCIYFTTNPPGASIYIDDILRVEITPALICGLTLGPHTYRLVLDGYEDITGSVDLTSGYGEIIYQDLIHSTGNLEIISTPSGAEIFIDTIDQLVTTPNTITGILTGNHDIKITLDGFNDYTTTFLVEAGITKTIPTIVLTPNEGCIYFTTNPPGASIYIDDILRVETTPALICGLTLGPHTYRLVLDGYLDIIGNVDLTSGQGENISQDFEQVVEAGFGGIGMFLVAGLAVGALLMSKKKEEKKQ